MYVIFIIFAKLCISCGSLAVEISRLITVYCSQR